MELLSKDSLLTTKIIEFYKNEKNVNIFLEIVLQKTKLSLRSLDWFVTNYSKKNNISYLHLDETYYPFKGYKAQLKAYSKKYCDPFCRRERVIYDYKNNIILKLDDSLISNNSIITTIGQLNFFKFAITFGIINYAINHITEIEQDMNSTLKNRDSEKKFLKIESIKRKELSKCANRSVNITIVNAVIKFI
jgi:hypothetical protein